MSNVKIGPPPLSPRSPFCILDLVSFCHCRVESKGGKIRGVKHWRTALASLAVVSASITLADDFKTLDGKQYRNATVSRVERDGIVLRTKSGISKVYFVELPADVQERFATLTGKAVTQRIDKGESTKQPAVFVDFADRVAQQVTKRLDERESILQGKHTPGPAELMVIRELNFNKAVLAGIAIIAIVLFAIVWRLFK